MKQSLNLTETQRSQIAERFEKLKFWSMPASLAEVQKLDAKQMVLECVAAGKYHVVNRSSGEGNFGSLCRYLLDLPGLQWSIRPFGPEPDLNKDPKHPDYMTDGHNDYLWAMGEPSLKLVARSDRNTIAIRFLYLRTFLRPWSVKITRAEDSITLNAIQLDGTSGYFPGKVALNKTVKLNREQWERIEQELEDLKFWEMPTKDKPPGETDPDILLLEVASLGKYHNVWRQSPIPDSYFHFFKSIVDLCGIDAKLFFDGE